MDIVGSLIPRLKHGPTFVGALEGGVCGSRYETTLLAAFSIHFYDLQHLLPNICRIELFAGSPLNHESFPPQIFTRIL